MRRVHRDAGPELIELPLWVARERAALEAFAADYLQLHLDSPRGYPIRLESAAWAVCFGNWRKEPAR